MSKREDTSGNPVILVLYFHNWTIRQYADGHWDAAHNDTPALSPGFGAFEGVMGWVITEDAVR